jgi:hypothetical protein
MDIPTIKPFEYAKPEPSLCDMCIYSYNISGGSVSYGGKTFMQRYCHKPPPGETTGGRAIHGSGYKECEFYTESEGEE